MMTKRLVPDVQATGTHEQGKGGSSFPLNTAENIIFEVSLL